jgi:hypothetical protein
MNSNPKFKKYFGYFIIWSFLHLVFLAIGWNGNHHDQFWPFTGTSYSGSMEKSYDFSEFLVYVFGPIVLLFATRFIIAEEVEDKKNQDQLAKIEKVIENELERVVIESIEENPDPMFGAIVTYSNVGEAGIRMKQKLYTRFGESIKKEILDKIVEKVQSRILKKYFENFD